MKVSQKTTTVTVHIIGWCLLLLMPYALTYEHVKTFAPNLEDISFTPILLIGSINLVIFYFNYFYLVPTFLFAKQYPAYSLIFFACLSVSYVFAFVFFDLQGSNSVLTLVFHTAKGNTFQMLIVSSAASMTLAYSNRVKQIEKDNISAQLAALKSQINPHFLFNTLNSIYATTLITSPKSADMVERLSSMMRYTTKETCNDLVNLDDEIAYCTNYIELQKIRLDGSVDIEYNNLVGHTSMQIAPMVLIPFIENAFKHGVNPEQNSEIRIRTKIEEDELQLLVSNNKVTTQRETSEQSGLGIQNTKNRLQLIYPDKHLLSVNETVDRFEVELHIRLS